MSGRLGGIVRGLEVEGEDGGGIVVGLDVCAMYI